MKEPKVGNRFVVVVIITLVVVVTLSQSLTSETSKAKVRRERNLLKKDIRPTPDIDSAPKWTLPISDQPKLYMKLQHESVTLRCPAEGRPRPAVTWFKDGHPLPVDTSSSKYEASRFSIRILDLMSPFDRGNYTCVVSNRLGSLNHTYAIDVVVRLIGAPEVANGPRNQTRFEGESIHLSCSYYSDMESFVYWIRHFADNGSYADPSGKSYTQVLQRQASNGNDDTEWIIKSATMEDSGLYSCCATNVYGTTCRRAWIHVHPAEQKTTARHLDSDSPPWLAFLLPVVTSSFLITVVAIVTICFLRRRRYRKLVFKDPDVINPLYLDFRQEEITAVKSTSVPFDDSRMIPTANLQVENLIGEGAFGLVYLGQLTQNAKNTTTASNETVPVALKMIKDAGSEEDLRCFLKEIETMKSIGNHINVIGFLGCSSWNGRLVMAVEFARYGNLRDFLRQRSGLEGPCGLRQNVSLDDVISRRCPPRYEILVSFAYQVARGMEFLSLKSVVHRDVACRNVLLADDLVVKIADFGLTRIVDGQSPYYHRSSTDLLPIRWMAPESLADNKYSTKSDVWSFGILMWEIFSFGDVPYCAVPVEDLHSRLRSGIRLAKPDQATDDIYRSMTKCWNFLPQDRPTFGELVKNLEASLSQAAAAEYLLLDDVADNEAQSTLSDEEVFDQTISASSSARTQPRSQIVARQSSRSTGSRYSSWSSDHTGSEASHTDLLPGSIPGSAGAR